MNFPGFPFGLGADGKREAMSIDLRILLVSLAAMAVLCAYRFYDFWVTGFFVSDEFGYYYAATHTQIYGDRWFFGWLNIFLFRALGINSVDAFAYLLPVYMFAWSAVTLFAFYKILKLLGFGDKTRAVSLLSSFALISFVLLSLGFLTEPVGLAATMFGVYCVLKFSRSKKSKSALAYSLLAACAFGAAAGTREPYDAFLVGGTLVMAIIAYSRGRRRLGTSDPRMRRWLGASVVVFALAAAFFLTVPSAAFSTQVEPVTTQLVQSLVTNPGTTPPHVTTTVAVPVTTTTVTTVTTTINSTVSTKTLVETTTTTTISTQTLAQAVPFYRSSLLLNTVLIFIGGIILGWGPICFLIGLAGLVVLLRVIRKPDSLDASILLVVSLIAFGSYFVVSFIFAPDPYYFTFQNYSTIIRFSDTALPGYFVLAPFFLALVSRSRKRTLSLFAVVIVFLLVAVPVYEVDAASNIHYVSQNPFQLGYRSDAALVRDYFHALPASSNLNLVGEPYGWSFTPGVQDLHVTSYAIGASPLFPTLLVSNFTALRWSNFYLFLPNTQQPPSNATAILDLIAQAHTKNPVLASAFQVDSVQPVLHGEDFDLYIVGLTWQ